MVEFREMDSYLTSSSSEESASGYFTHNKESNSNQATFDNSLLRMGRELLSAAAANPLPVSGHVPRITIRLTRLDPTYADCSGVEADPRIAHTIECLHGMGIDVQLGKRFDAPENIECQQQRQAPHLEPTHNINLDLSVLIALVSNITHAPLPLTFDEARVRFRHRKVSVATDNITSGENERMLTRINGYDVIPEIDAEQNDENEQTRALSRQIIQEMNGGLLEDMYTRLSALLEDAPNSVRTNVSGMDASTSERSSRLSGVMFWTTEEARQRCLEIVTRIGGPREQRRARALLSSDNPLEEKWDKKAAEVAYWEDSRYPSTYLPLLPVHIIPSWPVPTSNSDDETSNLRGTGHPSPLTFFSMLSETCVELMANSADKLGEERPVISPEGHSNCSIPDVTQGVSVDRHCDILVPPVLCTSKLTRHTVVSMHAGASRGWTTLTANYASVRELLKEMKKRGKGSEPGALQVSGDGGSGRCIQVAIWLVDPRSLAEGSQNNGNM